MIAIVKIKAVDDEGAALSHADAHVRCIARLTQTGINPEVARFIEAEAARPDFHPKDLLLALARNSAQIQASLTASFVDASACDAMRETFKDIVDAEWDRAFRTAKQAGAGLSR